MWHWLAHKLGSNTGVIETFWRGNKLMVGFRCHGCQKLLDVTVTNSRVEKS